MTSISILHINVNWREIPHDMMYVLSKVSLYSYSLHANFIASLFHEPCSWVLKSGICIRKIKLNIDWRVVMVVLHANNNNTDRLVRELINSYIFYDDAKNKRFHVFLTISYRINLRFFE